jgi:mRNA interferase RelE/StbE
MYTILFKKSAEREFEKLPQSVAKRMVPIIDGLAIEPRPNGSKKLSGKDQPLWRVRVGDYRIVYLIEDQIKIVEIQKIGHRREIYR